MVERDCRLARETGATISIQHISAKESVELVRKAKKAGLRVFAEATPHHFTLTDKDVIKIRYTCKNESAIKRRRRQTCNNRRT